MNSYEITCIKRSGDLSKGSHDNITHIGYETGYSRKIISILQAIQMIQSNQYAFYVKNKRTQEHIPVIVVSRNGLFGNSYLRTIANGVESDNLNQLPECYI